MSVDLTRYQRSVLQALDDETRSSTRVGVSVNEVRNRLVGTQTSASVRAILNLLVWKGLAVKHPYADPRHPAAHLYDISAAGIRRLVGETR